MSQKHEQRTKSKAKEKEPVDDNPQVEESEASIDDILDEIDKVLEENAEEFVKSYVQKGGEL